MAEVLQAGIDAADTPCCDPHSPDRTTATDCRSAKGHNPQLSLRSSDGRPHYSTGELFVVAEELRDLIEQFPISRDQRITVAATVPVQIRPMVWPSFGVRHGSGLPFELEDGDNDGDDDRES